jgi:alpha-beta hydrolase superfamily lysophospholipase
LPNPRRSRSKRILQVVLGLVGTGAFALGGLTYRHAWALTHFADGGQRTPPPERLGWRERLRPLVNGAVLPHPRYRRTPSDLGLRYERRWVTTADGLRLEAWHVPAPETRGTVLLLHGYAAAKDSMLDPARALRGLGWSSYLVDFRGSGGSGGTDTTIGVHEGRDVAAAWSAARALTPADRPVVVYGASMGAAAALRAIAREGVAPDGLILAAPFDRLLHTVANRFHLLGVPSFPAAHLLVYWGGVQHGFDGFAHNPEEYAAAVRCPALVLHGGADERATPAQARRVFARLQGPRRFHLFEGLGHESFVSRRPAEWRAEVGSFLAGLERTVSGAEAGTAPSADSGRRRPGTATGG